MSRSSLGLVLVVTLTTFPIPARARAQNAPEATPSVASEPAGEGPLGAAGRILASLPQGPLPLLVRDALERNPEIAAARARARAAALRSPQVGALPDPMAGVTAFLLTPETRVGPQQLMVSLSQRFPWLGKLGLRQTASLYAATAAAAEVEALQLHVVTELRRLWYELGFLAELEAVVRADRETLEHYEELARARYASGVGLEQPVIKLQAEITKDDNRLLDIGTRRATLVAALNALRDMPPATSLPEATPPAHTEVELRPDALRSQALALRPELAAAQARIAEAETLIRLAEKEYRPDITLGLTYTLVGERQDAAGRAMPPPDDGDDVFGLTAGLNLPVRRQRLAAGVEEAAERRTAAAETRRGIVTQIDRNLGDLFQRLPLTWSQLRLFSEVLGIQAEQSLRSAEAGYAAGSLGALDLLDAERVLLEVRTATARTRADYAIAVARLEGAVALPLQTAEQE